MPIDRDTTNEELARELDGFAWILSEGGEVPPDEATRRQDIETLKLAAKRLGRRIHLPDHDDRFVPTAEGDDVR